MTTLADLRSVAALLTGDRTISIEPGDHWAWCAARHAIVAVEEDLERLDADACWGVVAHEAAHAMISRYAQLREARALEPWLRTALNAVEDARIEHWMGQRMPGTTAWFAAARASLGALTAPELLLATEAWMLASAAGDDDALRSDAARSTTVHRALVETAPSRRAYARDHLPPHGLGAALREPAIVALAEAAFALFHRELAPAVRRLFDHDAERLARALEASAPRRAVARTLLASASPTQALAHARTWAVEGDSAPIDPTEPQLRLARALLTLALSDPLHEPGAAIDGRASAHSTVSAPPIDEVRASVAMAATELATRLVQALPPRRPREPRSRREQGRALDLGAAMALTADATTARRLFRARSRPARPEVAFSLLVDLSGSMASAAREALESTVLVLEALQRVGVPCAVQGYQDELIPFVAFDEPLAPHVWTRLGELPLEIAGGRVGGHNTPFYNDDGPCLLEASRALLARPEHDKTLIVVCDGAPEGCRSDDDDLHAAVEHVSAAGVAIVAVGLGASGRRAAAFYPDAIVGIAARDLASTLARVVERALTGGARAQ